MATAARVNTDPSVFQDHERIPGMYHGWTRCYRMVDLPRIAEECRAAGVDPEGVYMTVFGGPQVYLTWAQSEEDADKLRLYWAQGRVTPKDAALSVRSPNIGEDQRRMYQAVLQGRART